jgi:hypothetical protein
MEQTTSSNPKAGKGLGIAGMVLGIVAVIFSFVPCLGVYALIPGLIGLVLSIVSFVQANKAGAAKGMAIAGIVCSLVGCAIAGYQWKKINDISNEIKDSGLLDSLKDIGTKLENLNIQDSLNKAVQEMQNAADSTTTH